MADLGVVSKAVEAVMDACFKGSLADLRSAVRHLLSVDNPDKQPSDSKGETFSCMELSALESLRDAKQHCVAHIAAAGGNLSVLQCLLTALPALAFFEDENGENPLFYAIRAASGDSGFVNKNSNVFSSVLLLLGHCGPNCISKMGTSPLHVAAELGAFDVCKLLVDNGADVNLYSEYGTPLTIAAIRGYIDIVEYLLSHGANPDGYPSFESGAVQKGQCRFPPPLVFACSTRHDKVFDLLLSHGASWSVTDSDGWTPLHCAAECGSVRMVSKLLEIGADSNIKVDGRNAYHLAVANGHEGVAELLRPITDDTVMPTERATNKEPEMAVHTEPFRGTKEELDTLVSNLREEGRVLVANKDYAQACAIYTKGISLLSGDTDPETLSIFYSNRSHTYLMTGDMDKAKSDAEMCISLNPKWPKGYLRLASVHKAEGSQVDYLHNLFQAYTQDTTNTGLRDLFQREVERGKGIMASEQNLQSADR
ncbi:ankyrin repeat family protein [Babesia bovis T2Bo]|uniref:Ankyrin repeat family protein n=1 Tax=Babesia bovis TaxID=5865 RepID=A7AMP3_BABBO|nr:ankyrin repeat family protein [Babesia bovis T2Bo]EDO07827.1 ankyrin repeat family protein [Babesia bovis T2Bo]|eukprot:XP_001611395.1 ankyrin repeat family protein [Babesia bovis T2Bo]